MQARLEPISPDVVLRTENLTRRFGDLVAVDSLTMEVRRGEVFGFLGPNGAGKSTSLKMFTGLLRPDAGRVVFHDTDISASGDSLRSKIGLCPQEIIMWPKLTCIEQLVFVGQTYGVARAEARRRGEMLLSELGLLERRDKLAATLSGGMQRRLNLILALVHDPDLIVLDEPEAGLDPQSRVLVREYVRTMAKRKTVIVTTHNMDEAERVCDRVAIIDHGRLLVVDTPENLRASAGQGDVLEIRMVSAEGPVLERVLQVVRSLVPAATRVGQHLIVRALNVFELVPRILDTLKLEGAAVENMSLRSNSLEDVFISLTGRRLRE